MTKNDIPYTLTNESINVVWKGKTHTVPKSAPNFKPLREAIIKEAWDSIPGLLTIKKTLEEWSDKRFTVKGNLISYEGEDLPSNLNQRIFSLVQGRQNPQSFFNFWARLQKNPSYRSVNQLWDFLNHQGIPLTSDGCFLAYKSVRRDFRDHHSGKFDNSPGTVQSMSRNKISDDPKVACHDGFHVGALGYAKSFGGDDSRLVVCKVDPQDVVSVPYDAAAQKMRVCRYKVIGNYGSQLPDSLINEEYLPVSGLPSLSSPSGRVFPGDASPSGSPVTSPTPTLKATKKPKVDRKWKKYEKMDVTKLMAVDRDILRSYASKGLQIVRASKIPGGKIALVQAILQTRYEET